MNSGRWRFYLRAKSGANSLGGSVWYSAALSTQYTSFFDRWLRMAKDVQGQWRWVLMKEIKKISTECLEPHSFLDRIQCTICTTRIIQIDWGDQYDKGFWSPTKLTTPVTKPSLKTHRGEKSNKTNSPLKPILEVELRTNFARAAKIEKTMSNAAPAKLSVL